MGRPAPDRYPSLRRDKWYPVSVHGEDDLGGLWIRTGYRTFCLATSGANISAAHRRTSRAFSSVSTRFGHPFIVPLVCWVRLMKASRDSGERNREIGRS